MNYETEYALQRAHSNNLMPIRFTRFDGDYYELRAATGEKKRIAAGRVQTAWGNAGNPERGKWAVAWMSGGEMIPKKKKS